MPPKLVDITPQYFFLSHVSPKGRFGVGSVNCVYICHKFLIWADGRQGKRREMGGSSKESRESTI